MHANHLLALRAGIETAANIEVRLFIVDRGKMQAYSSLELCSSTLTVIDTESSEASC